MVSICSLKSAEIEQFNKIAGLFSLASSPRDKPEKTNPQPQSKYFCKSGTFTSIPWEHSLMPVELVYKPGRELTASEAI